MFKVAAITAAILLLLVAALLVAAFKAGRAAERRSASGVQYKLHQDMVKFVHNMVGGTSLDTDYWSNMSPKATQEAEQLLQRYRKSIGN